MWIIARRMGASHTLAEVMIDRFVLDLKQRPPDVALEIAGRALRRLRRVLSTK